MMLASCHSRSGQLAKDRKIDKLSSQLRIEKEKNFRFKDSLRIIKKNNVSSCMYYGNKTPHIHTCELDY